MNNSRREFIKKSLMTLQLLDYQFATCLPTGRFAIINYLNSQSLT